MSEDIKLKRFGNYLILDHLVDGGMAKICRARILSEEVNKIVAIKMIQPQYSKDPSFVQMFQDELKVTFGLSHPNIAQTYDYGMVDKRLYTAMEYVDGANLKQYLDRLKEKKFVFPVEISTYIISQVCQALYYAHSFTDKLTGKKFNIIHRDISPHNIMLTYDGNIKVIDFGIAKAETNSESTQAGTIKGKLSYLAPEYLEGLDLDHAYDQFAVGITFWEMLCSRKLFQAKNDLAVLKLIQSCKVPPPSSINPNVPPELDKIVLTALNKDRSKRFENLDKLNRSLVKFLYSNYPDFNPSDLSYFSKELFKEEIRKDRENLVEYGKIDITKYLHDLKVNGANSQGRPPAQPGGTGKDGMPEVPKSSGVRKMELDLNLEEDADFELDITKKKKAAKKQPEKPESKVRTAAAANAENNRYNRTGTREISRLRAGTGSASGISATQRSRPNRSSSYNLKPKYEEKKSSNSMVALLLLAVLGGVGYQKKDMIMKMVGMEKEQVEEVDPTEDYEEVGKIVLHNLEPSMSVYINGKLSNEINFEKTVDLETDIRLEVTKKGYTSFVKENIYLTEEDPSIIINIPELEKEEVGMLWTGTNYVQGDVLEIVVEGEKKVLPLPIDKMKPIRMPAGTYEGEIKNDTFQTSKTVKFKIEVDKKSRLEEFDQ
jgi:serine/threonine-protein kinase